MYEHKSLIIKELEFISQQIKNVNFSGNESGVLTGLSGIALFQIYYSKYKKDRNEYRLGEEKLIDCIEGVGTKYGMSTYCSGLAGVGWVLSHLEQEKFLEPMDNSLYAKMDSHLYKLMINDINEGYYDFLHGSLGYSYYFLIRYNLSGNPFYKKCLSDFLISLKKCSQKDEFGIKWVSSITSNSDINLSLAHGMSSILNFLSRTILIPELQAISKELLIESTEFICSKLNKNENPFVFFPSTLKSEDKELIYNSRLAWCYGDLGIGISLLKSARATNNTQLNHQILQMLFSTTRRKTEQQTNVNDPMICHGSFGLYTMYDYLYDLTKNRHFYEASIYWFNKGFNQKDENLKTYAMWNAELFRYDKNDTLLNGLSGVGLSLISFLTGWNRWTESIMLK